MSIPKSNIQPNVFKRVSLTAVGPTTIWAGAVGQRILLMGTIISISGNATQAAAGNFSINVIDSVGGNLNLDENIQLPAAPLNNSFCEHYGPVYYGDGILLSSNGSLTVQLSAALTSGFIAMKAWGRIVNG